MTLYTLDTSDASALKLAREAVLFRAKDDAEATDIAQKSLVDFRVQEWERGFFSEYWHCFYNEPDLDADGRATVDGILCDVQKPGSHPGVKCWWLTPVEEVMVPVLVEHDEQAA